MYHIHFSEYSSSPSQRKVFETKRPVTSSSRTRCISNTAAYDRNKAHNNSNVHI